MAPTRTWGTAVRWTCLCVVLVAGSTNACPVCTRAEAADGGSTAKGFAVAGGLLLAGPFVLAGVFGLLLGRTLANAGGPAAVKEST
jgi:hypothetical protein